MVPEKIDEVAQKLWAELYERPFRGKERGRFVLTREQMRHALGVEKLHASTVQRLQDAALSLGLVVIDLDDLFPCIEVEIVRNYRRPPNAVFHDVFIVAERDETLFEDDD